ncbi:MAG TPA: hypothetical protein VFV42_11770 [Acidimicrobiales bacterium]|nr:hypothetical protein [Acidimicrobiales bacterium]
MRVLRLRVDGRRIVDLHPSLSVVTGLDADQAAALRRGVAAIAAGVAPPGDGLLEAHGLLFDADQDDLDLLDLATDPVGAVLTAADLAPVEGSGGLDGTDVRRAAERDVLLLATDRRWASRALAAAAADGPAARDLARAEQLRVAIALHEGMDVDGVRRALDAHRDANRATSRGAVARTIPGLLAALEHVGLHLRPAAVDGDEVRRVAEDLLDEHARHAGWVVGARVELDGLEHRLVRALPAADGPRSTPPSVASLPESAERRVERTTTALEVAIANADERRDEVVAGTGAVPARDLEWALLRALSDRRRDHPAGSVPVVLDRVLRGLADAEVEQLLERVEPLGRGVQLVLLDDHPAAIRWAGTAGPARAATVHPTPARPAEPSPTMPAEP